MTYNTKDQIKLVVGLDLKLYFKHLEITPGYSFQQFKAQYINFDKNKTVKTINYNYSNHLISIQLKWNF